jgi:hypothetical protein
MKTARFAFVALLAALLAFPATASKGNGWGVREPTFHDVINKVKMMPANSELQHRAWNQHQMNVLNVMWEDTGRSLGSSLGPNISDLTLQVHEKTARGTRTHLLPVIRHPNFTDKTADIAADKLWVRVGNQHSDQKPAAMPLTEVLANMKEYLTDPGSLKGDGNFLAERDTHFLVSAQHVYVPLPKTGKVEFNPVLFNYQSSPGSPAVLTLLVTRQGTSATIIENRGSEMSQSGYGQQLFFNHKGEKTLFTAERKSTVKARIESGRAQAQDDGALEEGADMMMIVQVPLKHRNRGRLDGLGSMGAGFGGGGLDFDAPMSAAEAAPMASGMAQPKRRSRGGRPERSDVEQAVLGHGEDLGKFEEMRGKKLVRDTRFPVRVTIQFYKATSNGVVSDTDLADAAGTIAKVYESADFVGSLVVPKSQQVRPTAWTSPPPMLGFLKPIAF